MLYRSIKLLLIVISITISFPTLAASLDGCEKRGAFCTKIKTEYITDTINITDDFGNTAKATIKYAFTHETHMEDGVIESRELKRVDMGIVEIKVTLNNCKYEGQCGLPEFRKYLDYHGTSSELFFRTMFAKSTNVVAKKAVDKFFKMENSITLQDIINTISQLYKNMKRPVYIRFLTASGQVIGYIRIGLGANGKLIITENMIYDIKDDEKIIHGTDGILYRDDFFRDMTYTRHRIKSCRNEVFTYTDFDGSMTQSTRMVCVYTWR